MVLSTVLWTPNFPARSSNYCLFHRILLPRSPCSIDSIHCFFSVDGNTYALYREFFWQYLRIFDGWKRRQQLSSVSRNQIWSVLFPTWKGLWTNLQQQDANGITAVRNWNTDESVRYKSNYYVAIRGVLFWGCQKCLGSHGNLENKARTRAHFKEDLDKRFPVKPCLPECISKVSLFKFYFVYILVVWSRDKSIFSRDPVLGFFPANTQQITDILSVEPFF